LREQIQIVIPHGNLVHAAVDVPYVIDPGFNQSLVQVPASRDQVVLVAAADPQQTQLVFGLLDLWNEGIGLLEVGRGGEAADPCEFVDVVYAEIEALAATHG